jgi:hypothetical protein
MHASHHAGTRRKEKRSKEKKRKEKKRGCGAKIDEASASKKACVIAYQRLVNSFVCVWKAKRLASSGDGLRNGVLMTGQVGSKSWASR